MAERSTISTSPGQLIKGLQKDQEDIYTSEGSWFHLRNGTIVSRNGDLGTVSNEPSNLHCSDVPFTTIGTIHLMEDLWAVFSTNDVNSEIGFFDEDKCCYTRIVRDPCLGFDRAFLVKGVSKENFDCSWQVYWDDGLNPSRSMNIGNIR